MKINSHSGWQQLKHVWLGDVYPTTFYYDYDVEVRDALVEITEKTKEDLAGIEKILKDEGVTVTRPTFAKQRGQYFDTNLNLVKPPIMPRDRGLVLGNTLYHQRTGSLADPWEYALQELKGTIVTSNPGDDANCIAGPSVVRCGRDLFVDYESHEHVMPQVSEQFLRWAQDYRVHMIRTGGHSDGVFCPVKPGTIATTHWKQDYKQSFPGWTVFSMPEETPRGDESFGEWYAEGVSQTGKFAEHIQQYAQDWVGDSRETQFSVNMLVINENTVLAISENPRLLDFLDSQGIRVLVGEFRCKSFWDGGAHCLTLDIEREGVCEDYFPDHNNENYLRWID